MLQRYGHNQVDLITDNNRQDQITEYIEPTEYTDVGQVLIQHLLKLRLARSTRETYANYLKVFFGWCEERGWMPQDPKAIQEFIAEKSVLMDVLDSIDNESLDMPTEALNLMRSVRESIESNSSDDDGSKSKDRWRKSSLVKMRVALNKIFPDAASDPLLMEMMKGVMRNDTEAEKQAEPLRAIDMAFIRRTAEDAEFKPGPKEEWKMSVALASVMRAGLLRSDEAVKLVWEDMRDRTIELGPTKTDQEGTRRDVVVLSPTAMRDLLAYAGDPLPKEGRIFPITTRSLRNKMRLVGLRSGRGHSERGFSGHSCRVGMAMDMMDAGCDLLEIQQAGRWGSPNMPGRYTRRQRALQGPVARYFETHDE